MNNHQKQETDSYINTSDELVYFNLQIKLEFFLKDRNSSLFSSYHCPICYLSLYKKDIYQCKNGHIQCKECWVNCLKNIKECPGCRKELEFNDLSKLLYASNLINSSEIHCPFYFNQELLLNKKILYMGEEQRSLYIDKEGCKELIKIENLKNHLSNCNFRLIKCSNDNCNIFYRKNQFEDHDKDCKLKLKLCKICYNLEQNDLLFLKDCNISKMISIIKNIDKNIELMTSCITSCENINNYDEIMKFLLDVKKRDHIVNNSLSENKFLVNTNNHYFKIIEKINLFQSFPQNGFISYKDKIEIKIKNIKINYNINLIGNKIEFEFDLEQQPEHCYIGVIVKIKENILYNENQPNPQIVDFETCFKEINFDYKIQFLKNYK